jgi:Lipid A disaccharide synthetase
LIKVKYISLVNLILDQPLVKELIQHSCTPENMAKELLALQNEKHRARVLQKYDKIREMLGGEGASVKVAKAMVEEYTSLRDAQRYYKTIDTPLGVLKLVSNNDFCWR